MTKRKREDAQFVNLEPNLISYTQNTISEWINMKQDGEKTKIKLDDLVDLILDGDVDINDIKNIEVFRMATSFGMRWFSLDNRRLWVFKALHELGYGDEEFTIKCKLVPFNQFHNKKLTTTNHGQTVKVRGSVKHRVKLVGKRRCPVKPPGSLENNDGVFEMEGQKTCLSGEAEHQMPARKKVKAHRRLESPVKNGITMHINTPADNFSSNVGLRVTAKRKRKKKKAKKKANVNKTNGMTGQAENSPPLTCSHLFAFGQTLKFWSGQHQVSNSRRPFHELSNYKDQSSYCNQWEPSSQPCYNFPANLYHANRPTLYSDLHQSHCQDTGTSDNRYRFDNYGHNTRYNFETPILQYQTQYQCYDLPPPQTKYDCQSSVNSMMNVLNKTSHLPETDFSVDELFW